MILWTPFIIVNFRIRQHTLKIYLLMKPKPPKFLSSVRFPSSGTKTCGHSPWNIISPWKVCHTSLTINLCAFVADSSGRTINFLRDGSTNADPLLPANPGTLHFWLRNCVGIFWGLFHLRNFLSLCIDAWLFIWNK